MPTIHTWQPNESCDLAIRHLLNGECVALPTEATYEVVASALNSRAVGRLPVAEHGPAIVIGNYANLFDWLPLLQGQASRVFRKMGAGPMSLCAESGLSTGVFPYLPEVAKRLLIRDSRIAVRWPVHAIWDELRQANLPLVSVPVSAGMSAEETARAVGDGVACIIDGGPTQFGAAPTVVQAEGRRIRVVREGALSSEQIDELAVCRILFICTGNTCRSPMAEVLCAKLLADHLGCAPDELRRHGYRVESMGLAAGAGNAASPDAVRVVADFGADLSQHRSRMVTQGMLVWADYIFAMTAGHAYALLPIPHIPEPRLFSPAGEDVADPIGGELADYRACAEQIIQCLQQRLPEILES
jgi:L-threonylcarbamoyladenylate synthase